MRSPVGRGLRRVGGRLGVGQHQRRGPGRGCRRRNAIADVAAHRQPAEHDLVEVAGVEHGGDVVGHLVQRGLVPAERRAAEAALVGGDDVVPLAERVALLEPHRRRQRERVQQDDGVAGAGLADVQVDGHDRNATHRRPVRVSGRVLRQGGQWRRELQRDRRLVAVDHVAGERRRRAVVLTVQASPSRRSGTGSRRDRPRPCPARPARRSRRTPPASSPARPGWRRRTGLDRWQRSP